MGTFYIDGAWVDEAEAVLPVNDLAILRGYGVFDFLRTYNGRPFHLDEHIARLFNSARLIGLACPWSKSEITAIVERGLQKNGYEEANIRLLITGGPSDDSITPGEHPRLLVMITPVKTYPEEWYLDGVSIITAELNRCIPGAKSIDYIQAILTLNQARQAGAVESVYVDTDGTLLEGTTSNLFIVKDGAVCTRPGEILPGVTRGVVMEIIQAEFELQTRTFTTAELLGADEVFLTSSNKEVLPVIRVDTAQIGDGTVGRITRHIMHAFASYTEAYGKPSN